MLLSAPCAPTYPHQLTTVASDWDDIDAVVEYLRAVRRVDRVSLVAWSQGGPRSGGYAARHPEKVRSLVLLAPGYARARSTAPPQGIPVTGVPMNTQSRADFTANWDRQVGCDAQYDRGAHDAIWSAMLESDPVGATWGQGVRRAPNTTVWGFNATTVAQMKTPTLMVSGIHDKQVAPERVRELYADLGSTQKVFVDLGCSSHNAMWEKNHLLLFHASLEWLSQGSVNGMKTGIVKLGYHVPAS
jgi:pimeloyl-ACP methyl ester carboxylesterase